MRYTMRRCRRSTICCLQCHLCRVPNPEVLLLSGYSWMQLFCGRQNWRKRAGTWLYPPPAAPPLMPKVGPWLGCRMQVTTFRPKYAPMAWHTPTVVVDLPSPRGVGVMPATTTANTHAKV